MKLIKGGVPGLIKQLKMQGVDLLAAGLSYDDLHALFAQSDALSCQHVQVDSLSWDAAIESAFQMLMRNAANTKAKNETRSWLAVIRDHDISLDLFARVAEKISAQLGIEDSLVMGKQAPAVTGTPELLVIMGNG